MAATIFPSTRMTSGLLRFSALDLAIFFAASLVRLTSMRNLSSNTPLPLRLRAVAMSGLVRIGLMWRYAFFSEHDRSTPLFSVRPAVGLSSAQRNSTFTFGLSFGFCATASAMQVRHSGRATMLRMNRVMLTSGKVSDERMPSVASSFKIVPSITDDRGIWELLLEFLDCLLTDAGPAETHPFQALDGLQVKQGLVGKLCLPEIQTAQVAQALEVSQSTPLQAHG